VPHRQQLRGNAKVMRITAPSSLVGQLTVPGDKSISHRASILASIARGKSVIRGYAPGADCASTLRCLAQLGAGIQRNEDTIIIEGRGQLLEPADVLDCGNSGTSMRLLAGVLAAQPFMSVLSGDSSLRSRPMRRVAVPLRLMGAQIYGRQDGALAPVVVLGGVLHPLKDYRLPVASAQVKSCILLAGLFTTGQTSVVEPSRTRDHTERLLPDFGGSITVDGDAGGLITIRGSQHLVGADVTVPGDISSAAFWLVAGAIVPHGDVTVTGVGINPLRSGFLAVLQRMGCRLEVFSRNGGGEPVADIRTRNSNLSGTEIGPDEIPTLIDELPILAVAAALAGGRTVIRGAAELRHKETDRIAAIVNNLRQMGVDAEETPDGFVLEGSGGKPLRGARITTYRDHRIAMAFAVAGLAARDETVLDDTDCVEVSYPGFVASLQSAIGTGTLR